MKKLVETLGKIALYIALGIGLFEWGVKTLVAMKEIIIHALK